MAAQGLNALRRRQLQVLHRLLHHTAALEPDALALLLFPFLQALSQAAPGQTAVARLPRLQGVTEALALARSRHSRLLQLQAATADPALAPLQRRLHLLQRQDATADLVLARSPQSHRLRPLQVATDPHALPPPQRQAAMADRAQAPFSQHPRLLRHQVATVDPAQVLFSQCLHLHRHQAAMVHLAALRKAFQATALRAARSRQCPARLHPGRILHQTAQARSHAA